jgi:hypothetical protein
MTLRIDLSSDTIAAVSNASSLAVHIGSPVIALSRKLVEAGYPSSLDLEAYRGDKLCLKVRSIGEAAKLEVSGSGRFTTRRSGSPAGVSTVEASS